MDRRRFLAAAGAAALGSSLSGCLSLSPVESRAYDVGMTAQAFRPYRVTVSVGEEVLWRNTSTRAHTVTAYGNQLPEGAEYFATGGYDSERAARQAWDGQNGAITSGETYSHVFEVPGDYPYFCIPHEQAGMRGTVRVEE